MSVLRITPQGVVESGDGLPPIVEALNGRRSQLAAVSVASMLELFDEYSRRLLSDERTRGIEGVMFLSAWLKRSNLQKMLELNLNGNPALLDGFVPYGRDFLAAKPQGLIAMWMAGNVATLPMFSLVPALLTKNVCLVKLAYPEPAGMDRLLAALADSHVEGLSGADLLEAAAILWFDYRRTDLNEQMSLCADAKVIWGGDAAIKAIAALPRREHCVEITFGPKYSIGLIDRALLEEGGQRLEQSVAAFVRDVAIFDQRACSAPQTIFIEQNDRTTLEQVGQIFARHLAKLPPKPGLDPYSTMRILNARAAWALDETKDVLASTDGANWTVCMDRQASLKEAVQSRTVFLSEVSSWREVTPLLSPKVQTVGMAFGDSQQAGAFADAATVEGVARCVRSGLMNVFESPWDGKLLLSQLVRWVTFKP
jgi:hypothetical protein